jgi:hypothetical protein
MSSGGFRAPSAAVWGSVTALELAKSGNCKKIKCNSCEAVFAGGSQARRYSETRSARTPPLAPFMSGRLKGLACMPPFFVREAGVL